jgi:hypothetical protein
MAVLIRGGTVKQGEESVGVLAPVDVEANLASFVRNTVAILRAKHQGSASHEVVQDVVQLWQQGLLVDPEELDLVLGCDLNLLVSFREVHHAPV